MKKTIYAAVIIAIAIMGIVMIARNSGNPQKGPVQASLSGSVKSVALGAGIITLTTTDGVDTTLALDPKSALYDESGNIVGLADIKQGMSIQAIGTTTPTSVIVSSVKIVSRPPGGTEIDDPCPAVISEQNSSISCRLATGSRITISLPSASFSQSSLSLSPAGSLSDTFGASTQNDRWVRTFEAKQPGKTTVTVPSKNKSITSFKATLTIFGDAPADAIDASQDSTSGTDALPQ